MTDFAEEPIPQASAIPFRRQGDVIEFCLITSIKKKRWGFPKGIIDPGESYVETALKEAHEEAGIRGRVVGQPLGSYQYAKWDRTLDVTVVLVEVSGEDEEWDESQLRQRCWVSHEEASKRIDRDDVRQLLDSALERIRSIGSS